MWRSGRRKAMPAVASVSERHITGITTKYDYRDAEDRVEMLREWAEGEEEQYEIADVARSVPDCMKRKPLSLESLRRLGVEAGSREAEAVIAAALELHRASEMVKRPEFTDEIGEQLADSNPPLPS